MPLPPAHPDSLALVDSMHAFFAGYKAWLRSRLPEGETNPTRLMLLVSLGRMGAVSMSTLAGRLGLPKSNVTLLVDALETEGLVERRAHAEDRRSTVIELTKVGRAHVKRVGPAYDREVALVFDRLPAKERAALLATLGALGELLRSAT